MVSIPGKFTKKSVLTDPRKKKSDNFDFTTPDIPIVSLRELLSKVSRESNWAAAREARQGAMAADERGSGQAYW